MRERAASSDCPPGEELTAHAHGEGDDAARAAVARHLLGCAACRATHDEDRRLLLALAAVGAARSAVPSAPPLQPSRTRAARMSWLAWAPPAAAAVLVALALALPRSPRAAPSPPAPALGARVAHLLATQAPDGHWDAESGSVAVVPEAATGLVLLALRHELDAGQPPAPLAAPRAQGARWLAAQVLDATSRQRLEHAGPGAQAVALAALLATRPAGDPRVADASQVLLDRLARALEAGDPGATARPWVDYALVLAEEAALPGARSARRDFLGAARPVETQRSPMSPQPRPADGGGSAPECTPVRLALETLRDEAPLRALALGPACRLSVSVGAP